jgi:inosose dehydratase
MKSTIRVGNAPVSWGVYEADRPNPPFENVLDAIAAAGYQGTELGPYGYLPVDPVALDAELRSRNLALGSSFVCLPLSEAGQQRASVEQALKVARLLASQGVREVIIADQETEARRAVAGRVPADGSAGWNDRQWATALSTLAEVGRALQRELGMRVVVHHHAGTHFETPAEIDRLLAGSDPELVALLLDTGHLVFGGGDPLQLLAEHGSRVRYVHFKDVNPRLLAEVRGTDLHMNEAWRRGVFCALGEGMVDFPACTERLRALGYEGWVIVEQDVVPDQSGRLEPEPGESARKSRRYLREACGL